MIPGVWIVDGNNVMGAGADGWWHDRVGASASIVVATRAAVEQDALPAPVLIIFDGRPQPRLTELATDVVAVDFATRSGRDAADDRIVERVAELYADHPEIVVVTSDRGLRDRLPPGVHIEGARGFRERIGLGRPTPRGR